MNIMSKIRRSLSEGYDYLVNIDIYNQLQGEWITRAKIDLSNDYVSRENIETLIAVWKAYELDQAEKDGAELLQHGWHIEGLEALLKQGCQHAMHKTQDPKYGIRDNKLCVMATGEFIPDNEPVFMFRAKDNNAEAAIAFYRTLCSNKNHRAVIGCRISGFNDFKLDNQNLMKEPDTD